MTLNLRMVLQADSGAAKAALDDTARGIKGVTAATAEQATKSRTAATAAEAEAAAKRRNAQASTAMANANRSAAGSTGNLVAQLNDVGMMLAAGQNPLQLAIQQGTQITQVIGPMGAAGAARALGGAFMGMLNPINLVTFGVIAAGSAMVQWLTSADDDAAAVAEQLERQKAALEGIVAETESLRIARGMMTSGAESEDEQIALEEINRLLSERKRISAELEQQQTNMRRGAGIGAQTVAEARQKELQAEIASIDAKIVALQKQRELNAATENGRAIAERLKTATQNVTGALQSADGSQLVAAFASAFPTARALFGITQGIVGMLGSFDYGALGDDERGSQRGELRSAGEFRSRQAVMNRLATMGRTGAAGGGSGGGAAARDEADALQELIESLEGEIEALRVQDPIQKEMLRHREALAGATEAERLKVEELIATREREQLLMDGAKARAEFFADIGDQALESLIMKGASFNDVLKQMISSLIQAVAQAALLGTGPFGGLFGGTSLLGQIFPALAGKAQGGMVYGPGTATSDSIPTALSNGEFVVNARATARNRQLLEAINSGGRMQGYADGGYVGTDNRRIGGRGGRELPGSIYMDFRGVKGDREIEATARQAAAQVVAMYDREGLPTSIKRVSGDPRRTG